MSEPTCVTDWKSEAERYRQMADYAMHAAATGEERFKKAQEIERHNQLFEKNLAESIAARLDISLKQAATANTSQIISNLIDQGYEIVIRKGGNKDDA